MLSLFQTARSRALPVVTDLTNAFRNPTRKIFHNTLERTRIDGSLSSARYMSQFTAHSAPETNLSSGDHFPQASDFPQHESFTVVDTDSLGASVFPDQSSIEAAAVSLQALGLGSYTPSGIAQIALDTLHTAGLPWWAAIATTALAYKALTFPLCLSQERAPPEGLHSLPDLKGMVQDLKQKNLKLKVALISGNPMEYYRLTLELIDELKTALNKLKSSIPTLIELSIFVSFIVALNQMSAAPVASMKHGGALWFTDLTVMDPYYLLPAIVFVTEIVAWKADQQFDEAPKMAYIVPLVVVAFIKDFPAATLTFWVTASLLSLGQTILFNRPEIRKILKLPPHSAMRAPSSAFKKKMKEK